MKDFKMLKPLSIVDFPSNIEGKRVKLKREFAKCFPHYSIDPDKDYIVERDNIENTKKLRDERLRSGGLKEFQSVGGPDEVRAITINNGETVIASVLNVVEP